MLHPLISLIVRRPELVVEHAAGYAELVHGEVANLGMELAERGIALVVAAIAAVTFLTLAGVAVMVGTTAGYHWSLLAVPGVALLVAVLGVWFAKKPMTPNRFQDVKQQVQADMQALRAAGDAR